MMIKMFFFVVVVFFENVSLILKIWSPVSLLCHIIIISTLRKLAHAIYRGF